MTGRQRYVLLVLGLGALLLSAACTQIDEVANPSSDPLAGQGAVRFVLAPDGPNAAADWTGSDPGSVGRTDSDGALSPATGDGDADGDRPKPDKAFVTFTTITARNLDGVLVNVTIDLPRRFNVLRLANGRVELPMGFLPPGEYDQIVVVMSQVELIFVRPDGTEISVRVTPPGGGWTAIIPVRPFEVIEGETTEVRLRFRHRDCFGEVGGAWRFDHCAAFDCDK